MCTRPAEYMVPIYYIHVRFTVRLCGCVYASTARRYIIIIISTYVYFIRAACVSGSTSKRPGDARKSTRRTRVYWKYIVITSCAQRDLLSAFSWCPRKPLDGTRTRMPRSKNIYLPRICAQAERSSFVSVRRPGLTDERKSIEFASGKIRFTSLRLPFTRFGLTIESS